MYRTRQLLAPPACHYYPLGLQIPDRVFVSGSQTREGYTGHELDRETGDYYAGARYYLPELGRWTAVDPMEQYPSPYVYSANNSVSFIDPDGRLAESPIYDTEGNLLGTDDEGLQGDPIVMAADNFAQGMSHEDALSNNLGREGLNGREAVDRLDSSLRTLSSRPDWDGKLGFTEAIEWYNQGSGDPLFVDVNKINWGSRAYRSVEIRMANSNSEVNSYGNYSLNVRGLASYWNDANVYGHIDMRVIDASTQTVQMGRGSTLDTYDYGHWFSRSVANALHSGWFTGHNVSSSPAAFPIMCYVCTVAFGE